MNEVKPCPFCGHDDVYIDEVDVMRFAVSCPECECVGPIRDAVEDAIEGWNDAPRKEGGAV